MRKIYGHINGDPPQWLLVKGKLRKPEPGNVITVRNLARWAEPTDWIRVRVQAVVEQDGIEIYRLANNGIP